MKNTFTLLLCFFFSIVALSQERNCAAMEDLESRMQIDQSLSERMATIEAYTRKKVKELEALEGSSNKIVGDIITIPVVIHVLYRNATENISDAQIQSQIDVLNEDFRRTNNDTDNTWSQAADTQIEFCLAKVDPNGNSTSGITRKSTTREDWGGFADNAMKKSSSGGIDAWDTTQYLNMWVCPKLSSPGFSNLLGFAQFPGGDPLTDGVVMGYKYFGRTGTATAPFNLGRTTTHEVGHFLNLRHIWGDGACGVDDFVSDTPESDASNTGCNTTHVSCGSTDMVQNYMDYSDDSCMNLFTQGQKNRMRAVLLSGGVRSALANSNKCDTVTQPTCNDGVQNGDETGIDCGGTSCSPCQTGNQYCDSSGTRVQYEWIAGVQVGSFNNTSGASLYSDFTSQTATISKGQSNTITLTPGYSGSAYDEYFRVWIDYNQDGDFSDSGELAFDAGSATNTAVNGTISPATSVLSGTTRMRVSMKYSSAPNACGSIGDGEVEDYTVNIIGTTTPTPTCNDGIQNGNETGIDCGGTCTPCNTGGDKCAGIPAYNSSNTYSAGDKVVYRNNLYERRANGGWTNLGACGTPRGIVDTPSFDLKIYPNPVKGNILNISINTINTVSYRITNMAGKIVLNGSTANTSNKINVEALETGLYLIQFDLPDQTITRKFVKR
ncbi:M43 family zinc metalloprotease [uncultured Lacinutrix sp.]|uniref:M43 family zinc metalloprotease n=1 Tax=uncultured Lacinutrix sp. TaxID=574032 RepID=UPI00261C13AF|nr:M43 family zinc metalloprotease [uncultured Lacinutrix sp.]